VAARRRRAGAGGRVRRGLAGADDLVPVQLATSPVEMKLCSVGVQV
jgi:hypothetical protein